MANFEYKASGKISVRRTFSKVVATVRKEIFMFVNKIMRPLAFSFKAIKHSGNSSVLSNGSISTSSFIDEVQVA